MTLAAATIRSILIGAVLVMCGVLSSCALRPRDRSDYGIPRCPTSAADDLLSASALQCWFDAPRGRWRILARHSLYEELVVEVEASSLRDADAIARRFVMKTSQMFSEILVYVQQESVTPASRVRRMRWTRSHGFESLEFASPVARDLTSLPTRQLRLR